LGLSVYADASWFKDLQQPGLRTIGPGLVGVSWGWFIGGGYLAQPKCGPDWVASAPPEGDVRATWPLALSLALLAGVTAPVIDYYVLGPVPQEWSVTERQFRLVGAAAGGVAGALLPYVLPPRTWRAARELQHIRAGGDARGAFLSYSVSFF
jgi:hypothetical protein